eukprot:4427780-Amphidinium_carterae.1
MSHSRGVRCSVLTPAALAHARDASSYARAHATGTAISSWFYLLRLQLSCKYDHTFTAQVVPGMAVESKATQFQDARFLSWSRRAEQDATFFHRFSGSQKPLKR